MGSSSPKKIIALAFSDLHIHKFQAFNTGKNSRLWNSLLVLREIRVKASKLKVPLLFCGDLFHDPKEVENETMSLTIEAFKDTNGNFIAISGNHDMSQKNTTDNISPTHLNSFSWCPGFEKLDYKNWANRDIVVTGIPYHNSDGDTAHYAKFLGESIDHDDERLKILLLHTDIPGAKTPEGTVIGSNEHFPNKFEKELFKPWDLVLCGHIHKPQKLGSKTYMLGSPIHQTAGDIGTDMGYWNVYKDGSVELVPLKTYPQFVKLKRGEEGQPGNFNIPFEEDIQPEEEIVGDFNLSLGRDELANRYLETLKNKSKRAKRILINLLNQAE